MKRQKYGYIYRTHLFGNPTVRVTGGDNVRKILLGEHKLVSAQWPASVRTILGSDTLSNVHGVQHKTKKKVSRVSTHPQSLCHDVTWSESDCHLLVVSNNKYLLKLKVLSSLSEPFKSHQF